MLDLNNIAQQGNSALLSNDGNDTLGSIARQGGAVLGAPPPVSAPTLYGPNPTLLGPNAPAPASIPGMNPTGKLKFGAPGREVLLTRDQARQEYLQDPAAFRVKYATGNRVDLSAMLASKDELLHHIQEASVVAKAADTKQQILDVVMGYSTGLNKAFLMNPEREGNLFGLQGLLNRSWGGSNDGNLAGADTPAGRIAEFAGQMTPAIATLGLGAAGALTGTGVSAIEGGINAVANPFARIAARAVVGAVGSSIGSIPYSIKQNEERTNHWFGPGWLGDVGAGMTNPVNLVLGAAFHVAGGGFYDWKAGRAAGAVGAERAPSGAAPQPGESYEQWDARTSSAPGGSSGADDPFAQAEGTAGGARADDPFAQAEGTAGGAQAEGTAGGAQAEGTAGGAQAEGTAGGAQSFQDFQDKYSTSPWEERHEATPEGLQSFRESHPKWPEEAVQKGYYESLSTTGDRPSRPTEASEYDLRAKARNEELQRRHDEYMRTHPAEAHAAAAEAVHAAATDTDSPLAPIFRAIEVKGEAGTTGAEAALLDDHVQDLARQGGHSGASVADYAINAVGMPTEAALDLGNRIDGSVSTIDTEELEGHGDPEDETYDANTDPEISHTRPPGELTPNQKAYWDEREQQGVLTDGSAKDATAPVANKDAVTKLAEPLTVTPSEPSAVAAEGAPTEVKPKRPKKTALEQLAQPITVAPSEPSAVAPIPKGIRQELEALAPLVADYRDQGMGEDAIRKNIGTMIKARTGLVPNAKAKGLLPDHEGAIDLVMGTASGTPIEAPLPKGVRRGAAYIPGREDWRAAAGRAAAAFASTPTESTVPRDTVGSAMRRMLVDKTAILERWSDKAIVDGQLVTKDDPPGNGNGHVAALEYAHSPQFAREIVNEHITKLQALLTPDQMRIVGLYSFERRISARLADEIKKSSALREQGITHDPNPMLRAHFAIAYHALTPDEHTDLISNPAYQAARKVIAKFNQFSLPDKLTLNPDMDMEQIPPHVFMPMHAIRRWTELVRLMRQYHDDPAAQWSIPEIAKPTFVQQAEDDGHHFTSFEDMIEHASPDMVNVNTPVNDSLGNALQQGISVHTLAMEGNALAYFIHAPTNLTRGYIQDATNAAKARYFRAWQKKGLVTTTADDLLKAGIPREDIDSITQYSTKGYAILNRICAEYGINNSEDAMAALHSISLDPAKTQAQRDAATAMILTIRGMNTNSSEIGRTVGGDKTIFVPHDIAHVASRIAEGHNDKPYINEIPVFTPFFRAATWASLVSTPLVSMSHAGRLTGVSSSVNFGRLANDPVRGRIFSDAVNALIPGMGNAIHLLTHVQSLDGTPEQEDMFRMLQRRGIINVNIRRPLEPSEGTALSRFTSNVEGRLSKVPLFNVGVKSSDYVFGTLDPLIKIDMALALRHANPNITDEQIVQTLFQLGSHSQYIQPAITRLLSQSAIEPFAGWRAGSLLTFANRVTGSEGYPRTASPNHPASPWFARIRNIALLLAMPTIISQIYSLARYEKTSWQLGLNGHSIPMGPVNADGKVATGVDLLFLQQASSRIMEIAGGGMSMSDKGRRSGDWKQALGNPVQGAANLAGGMVETAPGNALLALGNKTPAVSPSGQWLPLMRENEIKDHRNLSLALASVGQLSGLINTAITGSAPGLVGKREDERWDPALDEIPFYRGLIKQPHSRPMAGGGEQTQGGFPGFTPDGGFGGTGDGGSK